MHEKFNLAASLRQKDIFKRGKKQQITQLSEHAHA